MLCGREIHVSVTPLCTVAFNRIALHILIHGTQTVAVTQRKCCIRMRQPTNPTWRDGLKQRWGQCKRSMGVKVQILKLLKKIDLEKHKHPEHLISRFGVPKTSLSTQTKIFLLLLCTQFSLDYFNSTKASWTLPFSLRLIISSLGLWRAC